MGEENHIERLRVCQLLLVRQAEISHVLGRYGLYTTPLYDPRKLLTTSPSQAHNRALAGWSI